MPPTLDQFNDNEDRRSEAAKLVNPGRPMTPPRVREVLFEANAHLTQAGRPDTSKANEAFGAAMKSKQYEMEGSFGQAGEYAAQAATGFSEASFLRSKHNETFKKEGMTPEENEAFKGHAAYAEKVAEAAKTYSQKRSQLSEMSDAKEAVQRKEAARKQRELSNMPPPERQFGQVAEEEVEDKPVLSRAQRRKQKQASAELNSDEGL